jgi:hypothetical protein
VRAPTVRVALIAAQARALVLLQLSSAALAARSRFSPVPSPLLADSVSASRWPRLRFSLPCSLQSHVRISLYSFPRALTLYTSGLRTARVLPGSLPEPCVEREP